MVVWFAVLALLGIVHIVDHPSVLAAVNPLYAVRFFTEFTTRAFISLGGVVLVVTGGEALYADLGHFGAAPIRRGWFLVVLPALLLNYFGQGALLLADPGAIQKPVLSAGSRVGHLSAGGPGHARHRHRLAGPDLGSVLADPSGDPAWVHPADGGSAHLGRLPRPGLPAARQLVVAGACVGLVWGFGSSANLAARVRDRGHDHDDHHQRHDRGLCGRALEMESAGSWSP